MPNFFDSIDMPDVWATPKAPSENDKSPSLERLSHGQGPEASEDDCVDIMRLTHLLTSSLVSQTIAEELERFLDDTNLLRL